MEEENDQDLEERLYAMLHYVDETQGNVNTNHENNTRVLENAPRSTVRRYWRTSGDYNNPHQKLNQLNKPDTAPPPPQPSTLSTQKTKPKEERNPIAVNETSTVSLSIFQSEPEDVKKSIVILENDDMKVVELESSDEDEVIEVALPPKPTITIDSSDEDESKKDEQKPDIIIESPEKEKSTDSRAVSASPVPSVVSSVSDEFIRGDCIALNISSRRPDKHSFDFSQHGSDLVGQNTPSKKKKKKKNKDPATSTPIIEQAPTPTSNNDETFVTPRSKAKNKKQKKSFDVSNKSIPSADIYDSDSNQSAVSIVSNAANNNNYTVTEKSFPSIDIYESDSSQPEAVSNQRAKAHKPSNEGKSSDCTITVEEDTVMAKKPRKDSLKEISKSTRKDSNQYGNESFTSIVDLTENEPININESIEENFVMANVTGFTESEDYEDENISSPHENEVSKFCSTKIPSILFENLDFDNLKGNKVNKSRSFSRSKLRAEMDKFYNESWGGEEFNHREIQKNMPRDKNLWMIDPKDRMPTPRRRVLSCNYCNRPGHRDETCRMKPPVCFMCGSIGHYEPRCPKKICVNCGSPNSMYSSMCRNCSSWGRVTCNECGQNGHPASHCPDIWRRYHNTTDLGALEECRQSKGKGSLFCSGCTRRGHLIHNCRSTLPFSNLPINSPYVFLYKPVYRPDPIINHQNKPYRTSQQDTSVTTATPFRNEFNKRQSQSPVVHETHNNKKKAIMNSDTPRMKEKDNLVDGTKPQEASNKLIQIPEPAIADTPKKAPFPEKALDYIPISSNNHDGKGQMIQDNEVSDTSNVVTSARIYVTDEMMTSLKSREGEQWLKATASKWDVHVQCTDTFLSIKGKFDDQESFQANLKEWANINQKKVPPQVLDETAHTNENAENESFAHLNIPRNRNNILRKLNNAFDSLKNDFGDPNDMYKELNFLQNRHQQLLKEKVLSPDKLLNSRNNINNTQKKLNLVLLGQAGLADGPEHLKQLHLLQQKVTNSRNKNVTPEMRKEIGEHFHSVFTSSPRDDYAELLKKFYISKQKSIFKSKKKNFSFATNKHNQKNLKKNNQQQNSYNVQKELSEAGNVKKNNPARLRPVVEKTKNKLVFFHKRLLSARPNDIVLKDTRMKLVAKLHSHIASLLSNPHASPKMLNRMRKASHQAQMLLKKL